MCSELQWTGALCTRIFTFVSHASCVNVYLFDSLGFHITCESSVKYLCVGLAVGEIPRGSVEWAQKDMNFVYHSPSVT